MTTPDGDPKPDSNPWRTPEAPSAATPGPASTEVATEAPDAPATESPEAPATESPEAPATEAPDAPVTEGSVPPPAYAEVPPPADGSVPAEPYPAQPYPAQPYPAQPYPAQQYPPQQYPPPAPQGTDGFAIAGFVLSILALVLFAVIFSILALRRIKRTGKGGRGFAIAGLVISAVWVVLAGVLIAVLVSLSPERDDAGKVTEAGAVTLKDLHIGDCVENLSEGRATGVKVLPCADPHQAEVVASFDLDGDDYPGETQITAKAESGCTEALPKAVTDQANETHQLMFVYPLATDWKLGGREVLCIIAVDGPTMTGSFIEGNLS